MRKLSYIVLAILLILGLSSAAKAENVDCSAPVKVGSGQLKGFEESNKASCGYLGIPFAAPPVGELRWKAPQPPAKWEGLKNADAYGPWCLQKSNLPFDPTTRASKHTYSEDCLYLNVWRPKKSGKFPVMVWIHGGGYTSGSAGIDMYRGDRLSAKGDVVVVNFNYRLNAFGYMAHSALAKEDPNGSTGNYGSLDQVAALKWVKENIAAFGGDPDNVTIFGESAGGWSVCTMVATPLTQGLFHRAIIESGGCDMSASVEEGQKFFAEIAGKLGCGADDIACMRKVPASNLLETGWMDLIGGRLPYINHNDGHLLKKTPRQTIMAGEHNKVPMIVGSNRDEARPILLLGRYYHMNSKKYVKTLKNEAPKNHEKALALYPVEKYPNAKEAFAALMTDRILGCPGYLAADTLARQPKPVYYYRFDYDNVRFAKTLGAFHGLEIPFVYDAFDRKPISTAFKKSEKAEYEKLSLAIMAYWTAFARTGDPNSAPGLPNWPAFNPAGDRRRIVFNRNITVMTEPKERDEQCGFWADQPWMVEPKKKK